MSDAFSRILLSETGLTYSYNESSSVGLYEHFYNLTNWSKDDCSTHYVIEARLIEINTNIINSKINLNEQHSSYEWFSLDERNQKDIHFYSQLYINKIKEIKAI